jgi:hypothetical protein
VEALDHRHRLTHQGDDCLHIVRSCLAHG